jgi:hypothetical protein
MMRHKTADLFHHKAGAAELRPRGSGAVALGELGPCGPEQLGRKSWSRSRSSRARAARGGGGLGQGVAACGGRAKPGDWARVVVGGCIDARRGAHVAAEPLRR